MNDPVVAKIVAKMYPEEKARAEAPYQDSGEPLLTQEMTDAEAIETLVRTEEECLSEAINPIDDPAFATPAEDLPGVTRHPTQGTVPQMFHVQSQIGDGVFVAWDHCRRCNQAISNCACKGGPQEPKYVTEWRLEYMAKQDAEISAYVATLRKQVAEDLAAIPERDSGQTSPSSATVEDVETDPSEEENA